MPPGRLATCSTEAFAEVVAKLQNALGKPSEETVREHPLLSTGNQHCLPLSAQKLSEGNRAELIREVLETIAEFPRSTAHVLQCCCVDLRISEEQAWAGLEILNGNLANASPVDLTRSYRVVCWVAAIGLPYHAFLQRDDDQVSEFGDSGLEWEIFGRFGEGVPLRLSSAQRLACNEWLGDAYDHRHGAWLCKLSPYWTMLLPSHVLACIRELLHQVQFASPNSQI